MRLPGFSFGFLLALAMVLILLTSPSIRIVWLPTTLSSSQASTATDQITVQGVKNSITPSKGPGFPPVLAYWIFGTSGDGKRMLRLLKAIYHPRNQYLLELDAESSDQERVDLASWIESERVFAKFGNVNVVGKSWGVNQMGASSLAAMLHAAALLLRLNQHWDWFINLGPDEYPLITPDASLMDDSMSFLCGDADLLHAISSLPRDLNFIHYTKSTDWNEREKERQIVVDPSLHLKKGSTYIYYAVEKRDTPDAFQIFGGSPRVILTRELLHYCVQGWDNLPRKLLMYFANTAYPLQSYFHTVLCNSPDFQNTSILNSDLRYDINHKDINPRRELGFEDMLGSGAVFGRAFKDGDRDHGLILDKVDAAALKRHRDEVVPGQWCRFEDEDDAKKKVNIDVVKAGSNGVELGILLSRLVSQGRNTTTYCHDQMLSNE
ncbi:Beta-glucuronosyltransferase GlcAT14C [Linum perenne]